MADMVVLVIAFKAFIVFLFFGVLFVVCSVCRALIIDYLNGTPTLFVSHTKQKSRTRDNWRHLKY